MNRLFSIFVYFFLSVSLAFAASTECPEHYLDSNSPNLINQKLTLKVREICYQEYAIVHSGVSRTPLASAECLRPHSPIERRGKFHPDPNLSPDERAELEDYKAASQTYDRGHMAPSADFSSYPSQQECFTLANMVPQVPDNNRILWEGVEASIRDLAKDTKALYVVTGPIFYGNNVEQINGRVLVPTHIFKAVYNPTTKKAGVYLVRNNPDMKYAIISVADLERIGGIDVFPSLEAADKKEATKLPAPKPQRRVRIEIDPTIINDFKQ